VFERESIFPVPRYPQPILMNPDALDYVNRADGISIKVLRRFTKRDLSLTKLLWDRVEPYTLPADRTYSLFTFTSEILVEGPSYSRHAVPWSDLGENVVVAARAGTEALCIAFRGIEFAPDRAACAEHIS
jgi:hypothetical protein